MPDDLLERLDNVTPSEAKDVIQHCLNLLDDFAIVAVVMDHLKVVLDPDDVRDELIAQLEDL